MMNKHYIDINCDLGEGFGKWQMGNDEAIIPFVSSVNIACGFHAGDPSTIMKTIQLAKKHQVNIGAHPGFPDLVGFGRRNMDLSAKEVFDIVVYQIGALQACAQALDTILHHVKPHGALYNIAANSQPLAEAIADAIYSVDPNLILYGLAGSQLISAGKEKGLVAYNEIFADRTYQDDGSLTPRNHENAIITNPDQAIKQVLEVLDTGHVTSIQGNSIPLEVDTICIHGDHANSFAFAQSLAKALVNKNIQIQ
jgi:UPF0271 protein